MKIIETKQAPSAIGPYSQAIVINGMVYTSGQIPILPDTGELTDGGITEQTNQVIQNLKAVLDAAGSDISHVVKTTCFLTDMSDFAVFNDIYSEHFDSKPARSCVAVRDLPKGVSVEIEVIAELL